MKYQLTVYINGQPTKGRTWSTYIEASAKAKEWFDANFDNGATAVEIKIETIEEEKTQKETSNDLTHPLTSAH